MRTQYWPGFMLLLGSWLQPIHHLPWMSWHSEVLAFSALAWFVATLLWNMKRVEQRYLEIPLAACLPFAFGLGALIQFAAGQVQYLGDALLLALYMAACILALTVGYQLKAKPAVAPAGRGIDPWLIQFAATVLIGALLSTVIMLIQAFQIVIAEDGIFQLEAYRRPGANLGQPNHVATLLLMGMASLAYLLARQRIGVLVVSMMQLVLMLGLAVTESRTGVIGAAALTVWLLIHRGAPLWMKTVHGLFVLWLGLLLLVWLWPPFIAAWHQESLSAATRIGEGVGLRGVVWLQLLEAVLQRPWMGWGLREISEAHSAVLHLYNEGAPFSYAHNILLDLAVGIGLPLTALAAVVFGLWVLRRIREPQTLTSWYCLALAIPLGVHSLLEYPHAYAYFLIPVFLTVGVMEADLGTRAALKLPIFYGNSAAFLIMLTMVWTVIEYVQIEEDLRVARFEALRIGQTPQAYKAPDVVLLTQLGAMLKASRITPRPQMPMSEIELLKHAANRFPWTAIQNRYAMSLALNGKPQEALREIQVMRAMHGAKHYEGIKANWIAFARDKYPEMGNVKLP